METLISRSESFQGRTLSTSSHHLLLISCLAKRIREIVLTAAVDCMNVVARLQTPTKALAKEFIKLPIKNVSSEYK